MRQTETAGVRLDERKTMGCDASVRSIGRFGRLWRTRCAIALAEEAQKSDPDLKSVRNPGDVGLDVISVTEAQIAVADLILVFRVAARAILSAITG
jgi:hypothetical protein